MKAISKYVEEILASRHFIIELMCDNLINISQLARSLMPEINKMRQIETTQGSVIMALKRYAAQIKNNDIIKSYNKIAYHNITVRTDLCDFTFENSPTLINCQQMLLDTVSGRPEIFCSTSRGVYESTVLISSAMHTETLKIYEDEKLISTAQNLAGITVGLPQGSSSILGLYYMIFRDLSWQGISIFEVISTTNEITLFVSEKDVDNAFKILKN